MCDEGYHELAKAIILQAIKDFEPAYLWLNKGDHPAGNQGFRTGLSVAEKAPGG